MTSGFPRGIIITMKNIAFVTRSLGIGGTEKALVGLINHIPEEKYAVTVFLLKENTALLPELKRKADVRVLEENKKTAAQTALSLFRGGHPVKAARFCLLTLKNKRKPFPEYAERARSLGMVPAKEKFDLAVAFYLPECVEVDITATCLKAAKKAAWIHYDVLAVREKMEQKKRLYRKMDAVYCVCESSKKNLVSIFPDMEEKIKVFHNFTDKNAILSLSSAYGVKKEPILLFTCSRISFEKQPLAAIDALKILRDRGIDATWYWAGGKANNMQVDEEEYVRQKGLEGNFVFLGPLQNPFPYYAACDVYVQTSLQECCPVSLVEAKLLCGKIVSTDFDSAYELLAPFPAKRIVGKSAADIAQGVADILADSARSSAPVFDEYPQELEDFLHWI